MTTATIDTSALRSLDLKTRYSLTKNLDAYLDVSNINNNPDAATEFFAGRPRDIKVMSPTVSFGVNARL